MASIVRRISLTITEWDGRGVRQDPTMGGSAYLGLQLPFGNTTTHSVSRHRMRRCYFSGDLDVIERDDLLAHAQVDALVEILRDAIAEATAELSL